jgi:hypothetical protein
MDMLMKTQRLRWWWPLPVALAVALLLSCGGGQKATSESAPKESVASPNHKHRATLAQPSVTIGRPLGVAPAPSPANASQIVQEELNRLPLGQIVFNPPATMKEETTERVEVRIADAKVANVTANMPGNIQTAPIQVSTVMSVQLQGTSFHVTPLDPQDQIVTADGFSQWDFDVMPTTSGDQTLSLTASVEIVVPGMGPQRRAFPVLSRMVHVQVNPVSFLTDNWQWFAGTILIPLAVIAWQWLWKRRSSKPQKRLRSPKPLI